MLEGQPGPITCSANGGVRAKRGEGASSLADGELRRSVEISPTWHRQTWKTLSTLWRGDSPSTSSQRCVLRPYHSPICHSC